MTSDLTLLIGALLAAALLQLVAHYGRGGLRRWAAGTVQWSGLLWTALALVGLGGALIAAPTFDPEDRWHHFAVMPLAALCLGMGFHTGGFIAERVGNHRAWRMWATQALSLALAVPGVLAGYALYALIQSAATGEVPFWRSTDLAHTFDMIALWIIMNGAVLAGLIRLFYNVRFHAIETERTRLSAENTAARLAQLEARLRPHFLLNALGGLAGLIHEAPDRAEAMTLALARLLQRSLDGADDAPTVPLRDELALVRDYLAVEQQRFGDRLRVSFDIGEALHDAEVPRMTLQPLVENAVKHGLGRTGGPFSIGIAAARSGDALHLSVSDDGPPFPDDLTGGHGLTSITERLRLLYGSAFSLHFSNADGTQTRKHIRLALPYRETAPSS